MFLCGGDMLQYEALKRITVSEYLIKLEYTVKENKRKAKEHGGRNNH
jgi:hypothetical protein